MSYILKNEVETVVFMHFPIKPIKSLYKDSLYKFLLQNVWGESSEVEEDIRVMSTINGDALNEIRYQFADCWQAQDRSDEIKQLINKHLEQWVVLNGGYKVVGC
jgi:hypothetical protein